MIKAIIFDIGGVLAYDVWEHMLFDEGDPADPKKPDGIAHLYRLNDREREQVEEVGHELWKEFRCPSERLKNAGIPLEDQYWDKFLQEFKSETLSSVSPGDLKTMSHRFIRAVNNDEMIKLLNELQSRGLQLGICSDNTEFWFDAQMKLFEDDQIFSIFSHEHIFTSFSEGVSKDDPEFKLLQKIPTRLSLDRNTCVFVDDRKENVEMALKFGFVPILFPADSQHGAAYLRQLFSEMGVLSGKTEARSKSPAHLRKRS